MKNPEAAALLRRLAGEPDVVMDNFAAGVMAKNGISYDEIVKEKPDIFCVSMSMAGQARPLEGMRGFASIATGYSGLELMVGYPDTDVSTGLLPFGFGDSGSRRATARIPDERQGGPAPGQPACTVLPARRLRGEGRGAVGRARGAL